MRRLATWFSIAVMLSLFSGLLLGNAFARGSTLSAAAASVVPERASQGVLVVFKADRRFAQFKDFFGLRPQTRVCWVSKRTLRQLTTKYDTKVSKISIAKRGSFQIVTVKNAKANGIRSVLRQNPCALVRVQRVFFLPFDPHAS